MEVAGLVLAIPPTIGLCIRSGRVFVETCVAIKNAETDIEERVLRIQNAWNRIKSQISFIERIWDALDEEQQTLQNQTLQVLVTKLSYADAKIKSFIKSDARRNETQSVEKQSQKKQNSVRRVKYAVLKEHLDQALQDLVVWQREFDPMWLLATTITSLLVDSELEKTKDEDEKISIARDLKHALKDASEPTRSVFRSEEDLKAAQTYEVPLTTIKVVQRLGSSKWIILDTVECRSQDDLKSLSKNIRSLAKRLAHEDPVAFGLLSCKGAIKNCHPITKQVVSFQLIFGIPEEMNEPQCLRSSLLSAQAHSLSDRLAIAKQLARSVSYVHTYGFVHKNVRPETVLMLKDHHSMSTLGLPFLLGFDRFRHEDGRTFETTDCAWETELYRHPQRQGLGRKEYYIMQHDIYSLGVCLLEIGLWKSFILYDEGEKTAYPSPDVISVIDFAGLRDAVQIKEHLVLLSKNALPAKMGTKYASIVETCLTCLDEQNSTFGDESEFQDEDDILISVRYIEKCLNLIFASSSLSCLESYPITGCSERENSIDTQCLFSELEKLLSLQKYDNRLEHLNCVNTQSYLPVDAL